ncbi:N-acetylglucosaminyl-phosphatidylinositol de-N-acetylase [Holothuria leucospilota]|uniref:N-acetylglucosaminylphosphatidylinositol deacetylase n=1 Tax=Holothuria leucospilota TaxID=206669 RepID=A0A9Q1CE76_HOLLE|nr:N-acetylglucosaminyl-phosphatidylinositol de-N-acetylase [Holothuria leucospilota]
MMFAFENAFSLVVLAVSICFFIYAAALLSRRQAFVSPHHILQRKAKVRHPRRRKKVPSETSNVLLVIAHPDDECMFFGPTLLSHGNDVNTVVNLLCLSTGDFYGEGERRQKELYQSCEIFGIPAENVTILNNEMLQDDPLVFWDTNLVAKEILIEVQRKEIVKIITFDCYGASGHKNHISVYRAVRTKYFACSFLAGTRAFCLETVTFLRHYISFLDLPLSLISAAVRGSRVLLSSPFEVLTTQRAMKAHWSQFVWFRVLNIMFSRYLVVNTLKTITRNSPT